MKKVLLLLICFAAVIIVWLSSVLFVPLLADWVLASLPEGSNGARSESELGRFGLVGDMFGAINALFSGLALAAIAVTLWIESKSRREARKPLVVGGLHASDSVIIGRPEGDGDGARVPVSLDVTIQNQSVDAALNVSVQLKLDLGSSRPSIERIDGPLLKDVPQSVSFRLLLEKEEWEPMLVSLTAGRSVALLLLTRYRSLEGVNWVTEVTYELSIRQDEQQYGLLNSVRAGNWGDEGVWSEQALVAVRAQIRQGTWDHRLD